MKNVHISILKSFDFFMLWFLMNAPMFQAKVALAIRYLDGSNSKCSPISAKYKLIHNLWKRATD